MSSLQEVLRRYGGQYVQQYGAAVPAAHREVLHVLPKCRTGELGTCWYYCQACHKTHALPRSCGNRHCATCQQDRSQKWLRRQLDKLLPCEYFLVTFTLPAALRNVARANQRIVYQALLQASAESMKDLAADPRHLGSHQLGFFGVLHTWGRSLEYHPHAHYVVAGGAISKCGTQWRSCAAGFFLPGEPLGLLFRGKFRAALEAAGIADQVDPDVWRRNWVVNIQPTSRGDGALKYLAPYVYRVAISDRRIESCENGQVRFRYTPSGKRKERIMQLDAMEFLRRFLQHVLPKGFHKVRHYGFLHPNSRHSIESVRLLIHQSRGGNYYLESAGHQDHAVHPEGLRCADCGGQLVWLGFMPPVIQPAQPSNRHESWPRWFRSRGPPSTSPAPDKEVAA
jgi:hypothetical protein